MSHPEGQGDREKDLRPLLIAFPTETVWGLGAPTTAEGWSALVEAKGRDPRQALQISCASAELALKWARYPELLAPLTPLWPGPLTLVVEAAPGLPEYLAPGGWVGLRVPAHPAAQATLKRYGGRLLTSSLNLSGQPPARTEEEARTLGLAAEVMGDGGLPPSGQASTVLRLSKRGETELIRAGAVSPEHIVARLREAQPDG